MSIYGVALLSLCLISGSVIGKLLGQLMGIDANVGGVGIAMILLMVSSERLRATGHLCAQTRGGILFWSSIYIPVVVAMAASQNVRAAIGGGPAAIMAGTVAVAVGFALVPLISRIGHGDAPARSDDTEGNSSI
ncbi:MAG TPA: malonate transporter subunit MadL [Pontiella sp.]|nr:malonate transporter subunit MadL [Pontiella sp.]